jgi:membrane-associated phospholipid phosphatase
MIGGITRLGTESILQTITDFGDSALLLPASLTLCAYLWFSGWRRPALVLACSLAVCIVLTLAVKIGFHACGHEIPGLAIRSPSGHTAFSTTAYGCGALLLGAGRRPALRFAFAIAAAALIAIIAISRILLHAHTASEVVAGLAIGLTCVAIFQIRTAAAPEIAPRWRLVLATFAMLAVLMHGRHLNAEEIIRHIAQHLRSAADVCEISSLD